MKSLAQISGVWIDLITLQREKGSRLFSERDRSLLQFTHGLIQKFVETELLKTVGNSPMALLSFRERQFVQQYISGKSISRIAYECRVGTRFVHQSLQRVCVKLGKDQDCPVNISELSARILIPDRIKVYLQKNASEQSRMAKGSVRVVSTI